MTLSAVTFRYDEIISDLEYRRRCYEREAKRIQDEDKNCTVILHIQLSDICVGWAGLGWTIEKFGGDGWREALALSLHSLLVPALGTILLRSRNRIAILTINILSASLRTLRRYTYKQIAQHSTTPL
jgi:hypothetical protein